VRSRRSRATRRRRRFRASSRLVRSGSRSASTGIHVLLKPKRVTSEGGQEASYVLVKEITKKLKGYTAREANRILGRTGQHFWQEESFDHWSRDEDEFFRIIAYIENNPVKAGLVTRPEDWQWSSAAERKRRGWTKIQALT